MCDDDDEVESIRKQLRNVALFAEESSELKLRKYQEAVARAVVDSIVNQRGLSIVVMFPRQSGKNELQAQLEAYLMTIFYRSRQSSLRTSTLSSRRMALRDCGFQVGDTLIISLSSR